MVCGAVQRNAGLDHPFQRRPKAGAVREHKGRVIQSRRAVRRGACSLGMPCVQTDVVVIVARRKKGRLAAIALRQRKPQNIAIECNCAVQIGHFQMNMADAGVGGNFAGHGCLLRLWLTYK